MTQFLCESSEFSTQSIEAEAPEKAAEKFVENNLDFDPSDPQDYVEVTVKYNDEEGNMVEKCIDVAIELTWTPKAMI